MTPSKISVIKYKENPNFYIDRFTTNRNISDEKKIFDLCQKIITPSSFTSKFINDHYKIPKKKIRTIPFGVNFEKYSNIIKTKSEHKDKIRFGFVGLVNMRKGIRWLIDDLNKIFEKN